MVSPLKLAYLIPECKAILVKKEEGSIKIKVTSVDISF
jgi:hypothetical protein